MPRRSREISSHAKCDNSKSVEHPTNATSFFEFVQFFAKCPTFRETNKYQMFEIEKLNKIFVAKKLSNAKFCPILHHSIAIIAENVRILFDESLDKSLPCSTSVSVSIKISENSSLV
jgi:hypothetical protein